VTTTFVSNVVLLSFFFPFLRIWADLHSGPCRVISAIYTLIIQDQIFDYLEEHINCNFRERGKLPLTSCWDKFRQFEEIAGYVVQGRCFDTGLAEVCRETLLNFAISGGSIG
jgi:UTP-glucose-1-phosphate uridylyltransferase